MLLLVLAAAAHTSASCERVRRNYLSLSDNERAEFHNAVLAMKAQGTYDPFAEKHMLAFNEPVAYPGEEPDTFVRGAAHSSPAFLPWHREYLQEFEDALRAASGNSNLTLPYWDWLVDGQLSDPKQSALWTASHMGGNGNPDNFDYVEDGPFAFWPLKFNGDTRTANPDQLLQRSFSRFIRLPTPVGWESALAFEVYDTLPYNVSTPGFRAALEGSANPAGDMMHNGVHPWVGLSMTASTSPNDPVFFLHHAFIDLLWAEWQDAQLARFPGTTYADHYQPATDGPVGLNLDDAMFLYPETTTRDVLDYSAMGFCYEPRVPSPIDARTRGLVSQAVCV